MAVTHSLAVRQGIANFVVDQLDEGTPPGKLIYRTSGDVEVATLPFNNPAFGSADGSGVCTANALTPDTSATGGTVAKATLENAAGTMKATCSVTGTGGGGDIEMSSVTVSAGQTVTQDSLTYTAPA